VADLRESIHDFHVADRRHYSYKFLKKLCLVTKNFKEFDNLYLL